MQTPCPECDKLWKEYEWIVFEQARAINSRLRARYSFDPVAWSRVCRDVEDFTKMRVEAQARIRTHNQEMHLMDVTCHA